MRKSFHFSSYKKILLILGVGLLIFIIFFLPSSMGHRIQVETEMPGKSALNQQQLIPVIEGYPYSLFKMLSLYIAPLSLSIYDDGTTMTHMTKILFFLTAIIFASMLIYLYKGKKYKALGLLLLLPLCIAPVFSPVKVTWYIAERYVYLGTPFFCMFVILTARYLQNKLKWPSWLMIIFFILYSVVLSIRTLIRTTEWKNPESLALATIRTAPGSIRPYNDLAGYYYLQGDTEKSKKGFKKTLRIGPSLVAMNNLGLIYLRTGLDPAIHASSLSFEEHVKQAQLALSQNQPRTALFYLNEAYRQKPNNVGVLLSISHIFIDAGVFDKAEKILDSAQRIAPQNADVWFVTGYLNFREAKFANAKRLLEKVLQLDPKHAAAQQNMPLVLQAIEKQ